MERHADHRASATRRGKGEIKSVKTYDEHLEQQASVNHHHHQKLSVLYDHWKKALWPVRVPNGDGLFHMNELSLRNKSLDYLSPAVGQLYNLERLWISSNHIQDLPRELFQLCNLTHLDLCSNRIQAVPDEISEMRSLCHLDLSQNQVKTLPSTFSQLSFLCHLNLGQNQFESFPLVLLDLKRLRVLKLNGNQISRVPKRLGEARHQEQLQVLELGSNHIRSLPDSLGNLRELRHANLSQNLLQDLPATCIAWSKLQSLDLSDNRFRLLPFFFLTLFHHRNCFHQGLCLEENPWVSPETSKMDVDNVCVIHQTLALEYKKLTWMKLAFLWTKGRSIPSPHEQGLHRPFIVLPWQTQLSVLRKLGGQIIW